MPKFDPDFFPAQTNEYVLIRIPEYSLVLLIGASSSGKSTFAAKHFKPTEVLSSDFFRAMLCDDENDQSVTKEAFDLLHRVAEKRLAKGRLTVIDATNVQAESRKPLLEIARRWHILPVGIVFHLEPGICTSRLAHRKNRYFGEQVIHTHFSQLRESFESLKKEGFSHLYILKTPEEVNAVQIQKKRLRVNKKHLKGPFDMIGDVHGCFEELCELLTRLGYNLSSLAHPNGRKAVFLGDLVDRGPDIPEVLKLVMTMTKNQSAFCIAGNHEVNLFRKLTGNCVTVTQGMEYSLRQIESEPDDFQEAVVEFIKNLAAHYVFDDGKLAVAHAGIKEEMQGRGTKSVRIFSLYGERRDEIDEHGQPVQRNWAADYRGKALVVYGHRSVPEPEWLNNTVNIDTGCVFGGKLTALRYPEKEIVSVWAKRIWYP